MVEAAGEYPGFWSLPDIFTMPADVEESIASRFKLNSNKPLVIDACMDPISYFHYQARKCPNVENCWEVIKADNILSKGRLIPHEIDKVKT